MYVAFHSAPHERRRHTQEHQSPSAPTHAEPVSHLRPSFHSLVSPTCSRRGVAGSALVIFHTSVLRNGAAAIVRAFGQPTPIRYVSDPSPACRSQRSLHCCGVLIRFTD